MGKRGRSPFLLHWSLPVVLSDGCASYFPEFHEMGLKMIKAQGGIFGWVSDTAAVLKAMTPESSNKLAAGASR